MRRIFLGAVVLGLLIGGVVSGVRALTGNGPASGNGPSAPAEAGSARSTVEAFARAWTTENYHDLHNGPTANPPAFNRAVFAAVKPGGLFFVEDHSAPGTGTSATSTLHRIDPAAVIAELTGAGFRLEAQSALLANPTDPHTVRSTDTSIRGETDKFALRFRKPR